MLNGQRSEELVALCQELIRTPSLSGSEGEMAKLVSNTARILGYDKVVIDPCGNVILHMRFASPGRRLLFHSQLDHVDPGDQTEWSYYPYGAVITNKKLYGRGASDQKGALAAMIEAGAYLREDLGDVIGGELVIAAVVQQEKFGGCSSRSIVSSVVPDAVVAGESSNLTIVRGQRGRARVVLETFGRVAHSSHPELGVNAAEIMLDAINTLKYHCITPKDPFLGEGILVLSGIYTTPLVSDKAIPGRCTAFFERKILPGENHDSILTQIRMVLQSVTDQNNPGVIRASLAVTEGRCYTGTPLVSEQFVPAWVQDENSPFILCVANGIARSGLPVCVSKSPGFGTSGCIYAAEQRLPTAIFGPCRQDQAHSIDEYIEIEQLFDACRGYYYIAAEFLKT